MSTCNILYSRLINQQIAATACHTPEQIVSNLVAMQSQDFTMAKWAIALRLPACTEAMIDGAFNRGDILRTHLLRPTWHFVTPANIRWLLKLTATGVNRVNAYQYRKYALDGATFRRCNRIIENELQGGKQLPRTVLGAALAKNKIVAEGVRLSCIVMKAELDGVICSGARQGKQFTYALLEERVPATTELSHEEALILLCSRYFASRGPATIRDMAYWSGLTIKEVKQGVAALPSNFEHRLIKGDEYIAVADTAPFRDGHQSTFLLPDYDEYVSSYKNRDAMYGSQDPMFLKEQTANLHVVIIDGEIAGTWRRIKNGNKQQVEINLFGKQNRQRRKEVKDAVVRYERFTSPL